MPDVYWDSTHYHPGILDERNKPIFLESKRHKAQIMKQMGLREAGDRHHGQIGTEGIYIPNKKTPNENVMKLKKIFQEHESRRNYGR